MIAKIRSFVLFKNKKKTHESKHKNIFLETQKTVEGTIKNILIMFLFFIIFNFVIYHLLTLNIVRYKRNKKIFNLILINS